jgi:methionine-rich copper-binding protein CopC
MNQSLTNLSKPKYLAAIFVSMLALFFSTTCAVAQPELLHPKPADGGVLIENPRLIGHEFNSELC